MTRASLLARRTLSIEASAQLRKRILTLLPELGRCRAFERLGRVLGCSARTARRIASGSVRIRRYYAARLAAYYNTTVTQLCGEGEPEPSRIHIWSIKDSTAAACRKASLLALHVSYRACARYELPTSYTVSHSIDGRPVEVRLDIKTKCGLQTLLFALNQYGEPTMTWFQAKGTAMAFTTVNLQTLNKILTQIKSDENKSKD